MESDAAIKAGERLVLDLLEEAKRDREKAEGRLVLAQRAVDEARRKYEAVALVIQMHRTKRDGPEGAPDAD